MMDVEKIIQEHLIAQECDGLCNCDGECGCKTEDIGDCETLILNCRPGYIWKSDGKMHSEKEKSRCVWTRLKTTAIEDVWDAGCGSSYCFPCSEDSPAADGYKFCPQCGKETDVNVEEGEK